MQLWAWFARPDWPLKRKRNRARQQLDSSRWCNAAKCYWLVTLIPLWLQTQPRHQTKDGEKLLPRIVPNTFFFTLWVFTLSCCVDVHHVYQKCSTEHSSQMLIFIHNAAVRLNMQKYQNSTRNVLINRFWLCLLFHLSFTLFSSWCVFDKGPKSTAQVLSLFIYHNITALETDFDVKVKNQFVECFSQ